MECPLLNDDDTTLRGCSVVAVEDDYFAAKEITNRPREHGATVLGPAQR